MKAVLLARVSSKEQEEGYSLDAQIEKMQRYCDHKGLDVIKVFRIVESSTQGERKQFLECLKFIIAQKECTALVVDKVDRLMRSFRDYLRIDDMLQNEQTELHFSHDGSYISRTSGNEAKMMWQMQIMMAEAYINSMRDNVKRGMDYMIQQGGYPFMSPIGYLNRPDPVTSKADIIPDPERAIYIKRLFEEYATGSVTMGELVNLAEQWGLRTRNGKKLHKSNIHDILKNPFYCGVMTVKGKQYPHRYERIIDVPLYETVQQVRLKASSKPFKLATRRDFVFRGLLHCKHCGCAFSSDIKKDKYIYLRPTKSKGKCDCKQLNETVIMKQVEEAIRSIKLPDQLLGHLKDSLMEGMQAEREFHKRHVATLQAQYNATEEKLERLLDMRLDGSITQDKYDKKAEELNRQRYDINEQLKDTANADEAFTTTLISILELASRAYDIFISSEVTMKRRLVSHLFTNLEIDGEKLDYSMRLPFNLLADAAKSGEWRARQDSNLQPSD